MVRETTPSTVCMLTHSQKPEKRNAIKYCQLKSKLAISVISLLGGQFPIEKTANKAGIVLALASFTSDQDPWSTPELAEKTNAILRDFAENTRTESAPSFWSAMEQILKDTVKPLFAKTRNPAITATGRKNYNPVPLPRFDSSLLDPESKPWKGQEVYATTVFAWLVCQYRVCSPIPPQGRTKMANIRQPADRDCLERHFPLLIPPLLTLIDDDDLVFKGRGCYLTSRLLEPIRESQSDILERTNLASVFEDAIKQCFFSLPTLTPENESIRLLSAAYPAFLSVFKTTYQNPSTPTSKRPQNQDIYIKRITKLLRDHILPSFNHTSSTSTTTASSSYASFPYPRLSTFLLDQLRTVLPELGIHTTKYLQDIIPLLYSVLANPFGTTDPRFLLSSVTTTQTLILNAHPRLWRWRGEILGGLCSCWVHVLEEEGRDLDMDTHKVSEMGLLKKQLKGTVYLLKVVLEDPTDETSNLDQMDAKETVTRELRKLIDADDVLEELLFADINPDDGSYFG